LILYFAVDVKRLYELGKGYPWQKPARCPVCRSDRLWGHGFVRRYFEPFEQPVWIKRYRCPDCGAVHTMRPDTYLEGLRYPLAVILLCLCIKTCSNRFAGLTYQLQQAWWKALRQAASVTATCPPARLKTLILELSLRSFFRDVLLL
jgi:transposase-like protein